MASSVHPPRQAQPIFRPTQDPTSLRGFFGVFRYSRRALELVWSTNRPLTLALAGVTLVAGVLPAGVAYVGALIVDAVVSAARCGGGARHVLELVALEGVLVAGDLGGAARHPAVPVAAARAARAARQRHDPREGAHARAAALRGLGVLRQADARAPRGLDAPAEPRDAHVLPGAERASRW